MTIKKEKLFLVAGSLWLVAGFMVGRIGIQAYGAISARAVPMALAFGVFLLFHLKIFIPLVRRHETRIRKAPQKALPLWQVFDGKSYVIMGLMIGLGALIRTSQLFPPLFFASFYTGLGGTLMVAGIHFASLVRKAPPGKA